MPKQIRPNPLKTDPTRFVRIPAMASGGGEPIWVNSERVLSFSAMPYGTRIYMTGGGPVDVNISPEEVANFLNGDKDVDGADKTKPTED